MSRVVAMALVFLTSGAVLVMEIMAGRMLAPYVGATLETFTGIIGTVLAGMALGSWLGGRAADRYPPRALVGPLIFAGGVLAVISPLLIRQLGPLLSGSSPGAIVGLAFAGFFAPALVLAAVTPVVVRARLGRLSEAGATLGQYSAVSTVGAISGTFVTGFVLIGALPTEQVMWGLGAALMLTGAATLGRPRRVVPAALGAGALSVLLGVVVVTVGGPCDEETQYHCVRIVQDPERASGRFVQLDLAASSYLDLEDPTYLAFAYARTIAAVASRIEPRSGEELRTLHIGGGGLTLPRYLAAIRPGSYNLVLELDRGLVSTIAGRLGIGDEPGLEVWSGDARISIGDVERESFDLVIGDAFSSATVPWHLTTFEFVREVRERLRPDGVYAMNLIDRSPLDFARAETATLLAVFEHVAVIAPNWTLNGREPGNLVLVGSDAPIDVEALQLDAWANGDVGIVVLYADGVRRFASGARVLTDSFAPVEQLITKR